VHTIWHYVLISKGVSWLENGDRGVSFKQVQRLSSHNPSVQKHHLRHDVIGVMSLLNKLNDLVFNLSLLGNKYEVYDRQQAKG